MRQHVNPLSRFFQLPRELPRPEQIFEDPDLPIHVDIGSARGKFLLDLARTQPNWNHLGLEIRAPLVASANLARDRLDLNNLAFFFCNVNVSLESWLPALKSGQLKRVSIQFPDPWFKRRHKKRRVLQPSMLLNIASSMQPGSELFFQSDLLSVIEPMVKLVEISSCFVRSSAQSQIWLQENPFLIPTEREVHVINQGLKVYRVLFCRNCDEAPALENFEELLNDFDEF